MERLNQYAIKFLFHVKEVPAKKETSNRKGSTEHIPLVDWSDKVVPAPFFSKEFNHDRSIAKIYKTIDGKRFGFDNNIYEHFIKFTSHLSSLPLFSNQASDEFILEETFNWVINSFKTNKIELQLIPYLQNSIEEQTEIRTYHFPVLNLHIEESFQIGNTKFQYFTKEYFDQYRNQSNNSNENKDDFDKLFSKYCGKVFISCTAKAEVRKSEEIAFLEASLAMDVFRLLSPAVVIPTVILKVDLEKRININYSSDYLMEITREERELEITMSANNDPYYFTKDMYEFVKANGLEIFSDFIRVSKNDELYKIILHSISFYSFALSIPDFHLRISQLIMIIEGLLLEEGWVNKMQEKTKNRLCALMFPKNSQEFEMLNSVMKSMYQIRHAITHKGNRLPIDKFKFRDLQITIVELLKKLILLNQRIKNKLDLIAYTESL
ncbi:MAG: hypothetical protein IPM82_16190 [Saprospiraceae bacterium]|nr:hypothetical protein [Saprospiraceae bacterium]